MKYSGMTICKFLGKIPDLTDILHKVGLGNIINCRKFLENIKSRGESN
jgi:hypothetical protein